MCSARPLVRSSFASAPLLVTLLLCLPLPMMAEAAFVKSVEYVEIVIGAGSQSNSALLSKGQTVTDCVPFGTAMATSGANSFGSLYADVHFTSRSGT